MRTDWDGYFLEIAKVTAERATCKRLKVGAVIAKDNRQIAAGYNGSIKGHVHCIDGECLLNDEGRCVRTIHAEMNAILHASRMDLNGATIYVTHEPCETCAKHIAQTGISRVVYSHAYPNKFNKVFLQGLEVVHYAQMDGLPDEGDTSVRVQEKLLH